MPGHEPLLSIRNLSVSFFTDRGEVPAVRDVSLTLSAGQTLALVGESGCGKSTVALAIMRLIEPPGRIVNGQILFKGQDLATLPMLALQAIRGQSIGMIFQEPMTSLNPVFTIGDQIGEMLRIHRNLSERDTRTEVLGLLEKVGIPSPAQRIDQYPHELSGGMKQRIMIAIALACQPDLLIADEPTTALDVTIQAQILELLQMLQEEMRMAILLITHNLGVVAQFADDVQVMYAGRIVESADVQTLFAHPLHPYTQALLHALPRRGYRASRLASIPGTVPSPLLYPPGCAFAARCPQVQDRCISQQPSLAPVKDGHAVECWLYDNETAFGVRK
ncbi:MAG: ABC transporter ATP-binding protein [Candidatus Binatia bacterium]